THPPPAQHACRHQQYDDSSPGQHHVDHLRRAAHPQRRPTPPASGTSRTMPLASSQGTSTRNSDTQIRVPPTTATSSVSDAATRCGLHRGGRHDHQPAAPPTTGSDHPKPDNDERQLEVPPTRMCPASRHPTMNREKQSTIRPVPEPITDPDRLARLTFTGATG